MGVGPDSPGDFSSQAYAKDQDGEQDLGNHGETQRRLHESALKSHNSGFRSGDGGKTETAEDFNSVLPD